jgi:hypothetical protein
LFILQVPVTVHVCEYSWVIDRDESHLDKMREWVIIVELCEILAVIDESVVSYSTWIGYEDVPMHWFSSPGSSEDVGLFVLDGETDKGEGSETFFCGEVSCMKGEEVE